MTNPYTHAALAEDRQRTLLSAAAEHRLRQQAKSGALPAAAWPRRWIHRIGAWLVSQLNRGTLQPLASEIPAATTREPPLAAWMASISEPSTPAAALLIRPLEADDRALLCDGFARLSPRSRQLRFLGAKASLSSTDLDFLTDINHRDKEALVALTQADGRGIGVARYTRDPHDPQAAEVAVTVIDDWHRRGVGTELLSRLITRAQMEGIRRFTALVSDDNVASIRLLHSLNLNVAVVDRDHQTTEYEITLPYRSPVA